MVLHLKKKEAAWWMVGEVDNHLPVLFSFYEAASGTALCLLSHMPSVTNTRSVDFPACRRVNRRGSSSLEETERVPDNYPYRLPPLSGRKEHTQSIMRWGGGQGEPGRTLT